MEHIHNYFENEQHWQSHKYLEDQNENLRISKTLNLIPSDVKTIIDVGCGNGFFLKTLEEAHKYSLFGIEPSKSAITQNLSSIKINDGVIDDIKHNDNSFDLTTCLEVIEHLPFRVFEKGLLELERISKKYIIISVPYNENRNHVKCPYCDCHFNGTTHMRSFSENQFSTLFNNSKLISLHKVGKTKEFKFQSLRRLFKRNILTFRQTHVCPQCNYTNNHNLSKKKHIKKAKNIFFNFLYRDKPIWYIALYKKNDIS